MTIDEIVRNKEVLIAQKKAVMKKADGVVSDFMPLTEKGIIIKEESESNDPTILEVKAVINTTNILDSHGDVHIKGIWNKSLKENKMIMHLQEHNLNFKSIISDGSNLKASVKEYTFKELGFNIEGSTQALVFDSKIKASRNKYMFDQYKEKNVHNHSVGMRYVKLFLAVNNDKYEEEKKVWDKYYPVIANKELADSNGYFWAVTEAKVIEGSAVPIGSNQVTPTIEAATKGTSQHNEPSDDTHQDKSSNNLLNFL